MRYFFVHFGFCILFFKFFFFALSLVLYFSHFCCCCVFRRYFALSRCPRRKMGDIYGYFFFLDNKIKDLCMI